MTSWKTQWRSRLSAVIGAAFLGCGDPVAPAPVVRFMMDSPTCGGPITFQFSIDQVVVGTVSLRDDQSSPPYVTSPGSHALRTEIVNGSFTRDTVVVLRAGETYTDVFAPYCS
jgi:hypothetical protein